jgi:hypothetical protein
MNPSDSGLSSTMSAAWAALVLLSPPCGLPVLAIRVTLLLRRGEKRRGLIFGRSGHAAGPSVSGGNGIVRAAIGELIPVVGTRAACAALARASFYRKGVSGVFSPAAAAAVRFSPRALDTAERKAVLDCLHEERFQDCAPAAVYAALLDEGRYHCSIRTMYRILELLVTGPNQLWSWDITKLLGRRNGRTSTCK